VAYCQFGDDSDVYVIATMGRNSRSEGPLRPAWVCYHMGNRSGERAKYMCFDKEHMLSYLEIQKDLGAKVPRAVFERLMDEIWEEDDGRE
jgi:hypothetical protein